MFVDALGKEFPSFSLVAHFRNENREKKLQKRGSDIVVFPQISSTTSFGRVAGGNFVTHCAMDFFFNTRQRVRLRFP